MKQNIILDILKETYNRFALKSPKFFQHIQAFGVVLLFITGIPDFLFQLKEGFGFEALKIDLWSMLPDAVQFFASKTIAIAGALIKLMAKLPVDYDHPEVKKELRRSNKMPYTDKTST
jgi:hypothetical protein